MPDVNKQVQIQKFFKKKWGGGNWKFGAWHEVHVHHSLKPRSGVHIGWRGSYIIDMVCDAGSTVAHLGLQNFFFRWTLGAVAWKVPSMISWSRGRSF